MNIASKTEYDFNWMGLYGQIKEQQKIEFSGSPRTQSAAQGALEHRFRRTPFYLKAGKKFLEPLDKESRACWTLGETFPELTQIMVLDDDDQAVVQRYLLPGVNIGSLNEYIIDIYKCIDEITQTI